MNAVLAGVIAIAATASPTATWLGLGHLNADTRPWWSMMLAAGLGATGATAIMLRDEAVGYLPLTMLVIWAIGLAACASCDAATRRIPTSLVRQAGLITAGLLLLDGGIYEDWRPAAIAGAACVAAFGFAMVAWRWAGLGRGDARLAALGGLGLGWSTVHSIGFGVVALCLVSLIQAIVVLVRGGDRRAQIPYALPITIGFLVAAAAL